MNVPALLRTSAALAVVALGVAGLTGCSSTPGAKRVALDMVETLSVPDDVKTCMIDKIEQYSADDLDRMAELADERNQEGVADLQRFEDDLAECRSAG